MSGLGLRGIGFGFRRGIGDRCGGGLRGGAAFRLEAFEVAQGAVEGAIRGIDAALEEGEVFAAADEIQALAVGVVAHGVVGALVVPDFGVGEGIAAQEPLGIDEGGDEERLLGSGGVPAGEGGIGGGGGVGGGVAGDGFGGGV